MVVYKCDICKKEYKLEELANFVLTKPRGMKSLTNAVNMDICQTCSKNIIDFLEKLETENDVEEDRSIFNERGKEMLRKIGSVKETVTEGYLGKV